MRSTLWHYYPQDKQKRALEKSYDQKAQLTDEKKNSLFEPAGE